MSLSDALQATPQPAQPTRARPEHPTGLQYEWDGDTGTITTPTLTEQPKTWDAFIVDAGLDPDEVEVVGTPQVRGWDAQTADGVQRMHYYRITVQRRTIKTDLDELVRAAKRKPSKPTGQAVTTPAYLVALGDLQLGKQDGDGVEGTVARFMATTRDAAERYKRLKKKGQAGPIYLAHLGDCVEGMVSQGGALTWRTTLTTTEQVRLYRRLTLEQIKTFAALTDQLVVCGVPGNHDEAHRPLHTYGDSWAIDSIAAVRDALELAGNYEHVTLHAPARDELTLTLDVCGTVVGMAHGHQWRAGQATTWWAKQSHGRQPIGDADLLLSAHLHHLRIEETGVKTWVQVPSLESESTWFRHREGEVSRPGIITVLVSDGGWRSLEIH